MARKKEKSSSPAPKRQAAAASWGAGSPASKKSEAASKSGQGMGDFGRYMTNKIRKLGEQFNAEVSNPDTISNNDGETSIGDRSTKIFEGISIHVNGYTNPSHQELRTLMLKHGGNFENYFSKTRVTHIICSNLPHSKIKEFRSFSKGLPVLKPEWIVDSIAAGKPLPWAGYQLEPIFSNQQKLSSFFGARKALEEGSIMEKSKEHIPQEISETEPELEERDGDSDELDTEMPDRHISDDGIGVNEYMKQHQRSRSTLDDPNFVQNYFKSSRLHFIGTWRNRYQASAKMMQKNVQINTTSERAVIHVDMDCFFVSVVTRNHPELQGKPVGVCHSDSAKGTGEISSANYQARAYGVKAGMFVRDAKKLCQDLEIVPYDFEGYEQVADKLYEILHQHSPLVQAISCDEAYVDVSGIGNPDELASTIRREVYDSTRCTASAGIARNLLLARLATTKAKPNGQYRIHDYEAEQFMMSLPVEELPGVGWALREKLHGLNLFTCSDLRLLTIETLCKHFGSKTGETLYNHARGIDHRKVQPPQEKKSIGAEVNWGVRFLTALDAQNFLVALSDEVASRLKKAAVQGRTFTMKVKKRKPGAGEPEKFMGCGICDNISRSATLPSGTNSSEVLSRISRQLFGSLNLDVREVRGVGLQVSRLEALSNDQGSKEQKRLESWISASPDKKLKQPVESKPDRTIRPGLPPVSEIDPSFLNSLPPELFNELNNAYKGALGAMKAQEEKQPATAKEAAANEDRAETSFRAFDVWDELSNFATSRSQVLRNIHGIYTHIDNAKLSEVLVALNATSHREEETEPAESIETCSNFVNRYLFATVEDDLEEVSAVMRLLKRLASKSGFWSRIHACALPTAQAEVLRLYDGYLHN